MTELEILKAIAEKRLFAAGFVLEREVPAPRCFGSYHSEFRRRRLQVRFVWDGKEFIGFLDHRWDDDQSWEQVGATIRKAEHEAMREAALRSWPEVIAALPDEPR